MGKAREAAGTQADPEVGSTVWNLSTSSDLLVQLTYSLLLMHQKPMYGLLPCSKSSKNLELTQQSVRIQTQIVVSLLLVSAMYSTFSTFSYGILEGPETVQPSLKIQLPPWQVTTPADLVQDALAPAATGTDSWSDVLVCVIFQSFPKCFILF